MLVKVRKTCGNASDRIILLIECIDTVHRIRAQVRNNARIVGIFFLPDVLEAEISSELQRRRIRTNAYWLDTVLTGSKQFPQQIEWSRTIQTDYADITSRELSQLAAKYLDNEKAAAIVIKPA